LLGFLTPILNQGAAAQDDGCPCDFDANPKTEECWVDPYPNPDIPLNFSSDIAIPPASGEVCIILVQQDVTNPQGPFSNLNVEFDGEEFNCQSIAQNVPATCITNQLIVSLTQAEFEACQCELQAYATALNQVDGISVSGGPPYICSPVGCEAGNPLTVIPTLNQWGMIIMAGFLGLISLFFILRRRLVRH